MSILAVFQYGIRIELIRPTIIKAYIKGLNNYP